MIRLIASKSQAVTLTTFFLASVGFPLQAFAHTHLVKSIPGANQVVKEAPSMVMLSFSESVEPKFSTIEVTEVETGAVVSEGKPTAMGDDETMLHEPLKQPLKAGKYHVKWRATSTDTHKSKGEFDFTYAQKK
jgi:methionine-rich copper-binding protein CopC